MYRFLASSLRKKTVLKYFYKSLNSSFKFAFLKLIQPFVFFFAYRPWLFITHQYSTRQNSSVCESSLPSIVILAIFSSENHLLITKRAFFLFQPPQPYSFSSCFSARKVGSFVLVDAYYSRHQLELDQAETLGSSHCEPRLVWGQEIRQIAKIILSFRIIIFCLPPKLTLISELTII